MENLRLQSGTRAASLDHSELRISLEHDSPKWVGKIKIVYDDGAELRADFIDDDYNPEISGIEGLDVSACEYAENLRDEYAAELSAYLKRHA
jgi:hypothetical protein